MGATRDGAGGGQRSSQLLRFVTQRKSHEGYAVVAFLGTGALSWHRVRAKSSERVARRPFLDQNRDHD